MANKIILAVLLMGAAIAFAASDLEVKQYDFVIKYEDGTPVPDLKGSKSELSAIEKIKHLPANIWYYITRPATRVKFTEEDVVTPPAPDPEPEVCPSGFEGTPPNCVIVCGNDEVPNGTGNACLPKPLVCTPPFVIQPNPTSPNEQGVCGCPTGQNPTPDGLDCEDLDMGGGSGLPAVDLTLEPTFAVGQSDFNIGPALSWYSPDSKSGTNEGDFRLNCGFSHMANDDPIVYPNQQGASHHHTFFGNTSAYYNSDVGNMDKVGNSTCNGGIANRSAYWVMSMIDTATNKPLKPSGIGVYYKTQRADQVTVPPKGLRIIAKGFAETDFMCNEDYGGRGINRIVPCGQGGELRYGVNFPNCWDGVNLDSPDHMEHMRYVVWDTACPASHPVRIPNITINVFYDVTESYGTSTWRLSSDPLDGVPGATNHADWVNGWDTDTITDIVNNCLKNQQDCHSDLMGDGRQMY